MPRVCSPWPCVRVFTQCCDIILRAKFLLDITDPSWLQLSFAAFYHKIGFTEIDKHWSIRVLALCRQEDMSFKASRIIYEIWKEQGMANGVPWEIHTTTPSATCRIEDCKWELKGVANVKVCEMWFKLRDYRANGVGQFNLTQSTAAVPAWIAWSSSRLLIVYSGTILLIRQAL